MADTNPVYFPGKDMFIYINGVAIGCDENCDVEMVIKTFDNSNKCTVDASGNLFGSMIALSTSMKITGTGFSVLDKSQSGGADTEISGASLMHLAITKEKVFCSVMIGPNFYGCDGYLTNIKQSGKFDEIVRYSYTFDSSGVITEVPVS